MAQSVTVKVTAFSDPRKALASYRDAEYREFLRDCGCPEDQIEIEVLKLSENDKSPATPARE